MAEKCLICGCGGRIIYKNATDRLFGVPGLWNIMECCNPGCRLLWLDPMPNKDELIKFYGNYYTHQKISKQSGVFKNILQMVFEGIIAFIDIITGFNKEKALLNDFYVKNERSGRLLEIGCGNGDVLLQFKNKGWHVEGVETDAKSAKTASEKLKIEVKTRDLLEMNYPSEYFDLIIMKHVIEHIYSPIELIKECYRILVPGGKLILITPNSNSLGHRLFRRNWRGLEPPRHLYVFSSNNIKGLFGENTFTDIYIKTTAANADSVVYHSLDGNARMGMLNVWNKIISRVLQYCEYFQNIVMRDRGEEIVLVAKK